MANGCTELNRSAQSPASVTEQFSEDNSEKSLERLTATRRNEGHALVSARGAVFFLCKAGSNIFHYYKSTSFL
jgi:hypothetical protein